MPRCRDLWPLPCGVELHLGSFILRVFSFIDFISNAIHRPVQRPSSTILLGPGPSHPLYPLQPLVLEEARSC